MSRAFGSIGAFVEFLAVLPAELHGAQRHGEEAAGEMLVDHAQKMIGEEMSEWPALAASTIEEKERLGYTGRVSATDPLLRTGELRTSISATVDQSGVTLGSTDPIAPYQEHGTSKMPARPFIGATLFAQGHEAADLIAEHVVAAMAGATAPRRR